MLLFVLCVSALLMGVTGLLYAQLEAFLVFLAVFSGCIAAGFCRRGGRRVDAVREEFITDTHLQSDSRYNRIGVRFASVFLLSYVFEYEYDAICRIMPYTGQTIDARRYVVKTAAVTFFAFVVTSATAVVVVVVAATVAATAVVATTTAAAAAVTAQAAYLLLAFAPATIPFVAPLLLSIKASRRKSAASSEFLPFLTYASVVHTVNKTMFWVLQSVSRSDMFCQLRRDAVITQWCGPL